MNRVAEVTSAGAARHGGRLTSLEAFRGFVIGGMLLVNNVIWTERLPRQLMHAKWNQGVTFTDMIFPWFLFAMGTAIPLSVASQRARGVSGGASLLRVLRRAAILIFLGILLDSSVARRLVIGLGVLQLLGLAYLTGTLLAVLPIWARLPVAGVLLAGHWALIRFVPITGAGAGILEEGQNIVHYLNQAHLARYHLAGIISLVPTSALVGLGTVAGDLLRLPSLNRWRKLVALVLGGMVLVGAGWLWSLDLPFNKPLWTAPFILLSGGLGAVLLGVCYLAFDIAGLRALAFPFVVFGANAIVVYVASILVKVHVLQEWEYRLRGAAPVSLQQTILNSLIGRFGRVEAAWIYTLGFIAFWWLVLFYLYRKRIFVRV